MSERERRAPTGTGDLPARSGHLPRASAGDTSFRPPRPPGEGPADPRRYWQVAREQWRTVLGTCAVVVAAVGVGTLLQDPVYRAGGMIEIRKQAAEVVPVEALFQTDRISGQYLQTQYEILRSPALARRVVSELRLVEALAGDAAPPATAADSAALLERAAGEFGESLIVDPVQGSYLVRVQFEAPDPRLAARAVNSTFENYSRMRVEAGQVAVRRLEEQVASARAALARSEARLNDYVRANRLVVVENATGERENIAQERLRQLQRELTAAEAARYEAESRFNLVRTQGVDALRSEGLRSLNLRVAELRGEYAALRSTFTDEFPRTQQVRRQLEELDAQLAGERQRIAAEIADEYFTARERQLLLQAAFDQQQRQIDGLAARMVDFYVLQRDVEGQRQLFATLQQKEKEARISAALATTELEVVESAVPPQKPIRPTPKRNLQLAVLVGLMLGFGLAVVREVTDGLNPIIDEVDAQSIRVLGMIPSVPALEAQGRPRLGIAAARLLPSTTDGVGWHRIDGPQPQALLAEAFAALRTSVLFDLPGRPPRSLAITSTRPGEGKTTVSSNLAISLARLDRRVLLIDADLRRPALHRAFGLEASPGLAGVLEGTAGDWRGLVRPDAAPGVDLLPAGHPPENPAELLSSGRMRRLVEEAYAGYDFVILDSPALMINAADARLLAPLADGSIVVIRSGSTPREHARRALRQVPNLIGVVLNDLDPRRHFPPWYQSYGSRADGEPPLRAVDA